MLHFTFLGCVFYSSSRWRQSLITETIPFSLWGLFSQFYFNDCLCKPLKEAFVKSRVCIPFCQLLPTAIIFHIVLTLWYGMLSTDVNFFRISLTPVLCFIIVIWNMPVYTKYERRLMILLQFFCTPGPSGEQPRSNRHSLRAEWSLCVPRHPSSRVRKQSGMLLGSPPHKKGFVVPFHV